MNVPVQTWTCPTCEITEEVQGPAQSLPRLLRLAQDGHAERHRAERKRVGPIAAALLDATEAIAAFRIRLVVAPSDVERVRSLVVRRSLPVEVYADHELDAGQGYLVQPRRGVRELSGPDGPAPGSTRQDDAS